MNGLLKIHGDNPGVRMDTQKLLVEEETLKLTSMHLDHPLFHTLYTITIPLKIWPTLLMTPQLKELKKIWTFLNMKRTHQRLKMVILNHKTEEYDFLNRK
jgi:hypothetical protein